MPPSANAIRSQFLDFFVEQADHVQVPSSPVVPHDDPTLLFTNAGMNQFKDVFLGQGTRPYTRAVDTQKCIRAGGKHNDLEDVGRDTYHHTFFEMLGNWSFGDYFKEEAIRWAFDLLTEGYGIDPDRLHATYFGGNEDTGLAADEEARAMWMQHLPEDRVLPFGMKDNFWEMGDTGPCGPCSELHFDRVGNRDARSLVNADDPEVIEIWNLVFIQFNRESKSKLVPLPAKHVDTGMGFERLVSVLQNKQSNYDTDLWAPIFDAIRSGCDAPPYGGHLDVREDIAYRVIADHVRCLTAAITDGANPGADGRGYVLRRILRRAVRHGRQTFGVERPFLAGLVPSVVESLGGVFPEFIERADQVMGVIEQEEETFRRTLDRGLELFDEAARRSQSRGATQIDGEDAFKLHDTFGFPIDLTTVMAEERSYTVDLEGYERLMEAAKERSRGKGDATDLVAVLPPDQLARLEAIHVLPTDDAHKYEGTSVRSMVRAIWNGEQLVEHADPGERVAVILDRTSFYAEQGGQVGDRGRLHGCGPHDVRSPDDLAFFEVEDTRRVGDFVLHIGLVEKGRLHTSDRVEAFANPEQRNSIRSNHTATHLLNLALRSEIGPESDQRGSMVASDRLRFDYAAKGPLDQAAIERIERDVCAGIAEGLTVHTKVVPLEQARMINSVRAVFGEQYPDPVRVVSIGAPVEDLIADPDRAEWMQRSVEFCGGTHLENTGGAGDFVLLSEQGLAAGIRRIIALTGDAAEEARQAARAFLGRAGDVAKLDDDELPEAFDELHRTIESTTLGAVDRHRLQEVLEKLRDRARNARKKARSASTGEVVEQARTIAEESMGLAVVARIDEADRDALFAAMDTIRGNRADAAVLLVSADSESGKVTIVARVPEPLIEQGLRAGDWVKAAAQACGGSGGGRPDSAQAGGKDITRAEEAVAAAKAHATGTLEG
ncbi:MAG: alanine--tRNA ligase [Planctomycetota bacterium]|nr:alanine--tRNA ligase [Planctomycetota bacterium]